MFNASRMDVTGEIQLTLGNGHVVPGSIIMDVEGSVKIYFTDPDIVKQYMQLALENSLVGLHIETLHTKPLAG